MKSNRSPPTSGSRLRAQNSRIFGSSSATRLGVKARESRRRWIVWVGGSSKMRIPGGISMFDPDELDDPALPRDVGLRIEQPTLHVLVPAQRVEVVGVVVVERRLLAQPPVHRVRVGVDLDAVRVVIDVSHAAGHLRGPHASGFNVRIWHQMAGRSISGPEATRRVRCVPPRRPTVRPGERHARARTMLVASARYAAGHSRWQPKSGHSTPTSHPIGGARP